MAERFGVVRGQSTEDTCARYALHCLRSGYPERGAFHPDPLDATACLERLEPDPDAGEWVLRFTWRPPAHPAQAGG